MDDANLTRYLERIEAKLDINIAHVHRNTVVLDEHIRRTEAVEKMLEYHAARLQPLERHVAAWAGAGKLFSIIASCVALAYGVVKLIHAVN